MNFPGPHERSRLPGPPAMQPIADRIPKPAKMRKTMKSRFSHISACVLTAAALSLSPLAFGQDAVTQTTTTTSDGTITEFSPDTVVLHSETSSEPLRYTYSKSTTVVDQNGTPLDISVIKTGVPVHVFYDRTGDQMVARKIVVETTPVEQPPTVIEKKTTTTTTTQGQPQ
jgi:hypothetical protein